MVRMKSIPIVLAVAMLLAASCNLSPQFGNQKVSPSEPVYTISGTLHPAREITLPVKTRVLVMWMVLAEDPGYIYIFGEGDLDFDNYSFVLHFYEAPPPEALNKIDDSVFGLGFVILTNQNWEGKMEEENFPTEEIIGISANHAVIYVDGSFEDVPDTGRVADFDQGYNVGEGVDVPDDFDIFKPVTPDKIQIIIDDFENIEFLNFW